MFKKRLFLYILFLLILIINVKNLSLGAQKNRQKIHPYNRILLKIYPRKEKLWYPYIPRITASEALKLYRENKAFFIHIGDAGGNVPGGLQFREKEVWKINPNILFKKIPHKYVILYCH